VGEHGAGGLASVFEPGIDVLPPVTYVGDGLLNPGVGVGVERGRCWVGVLDVLGRRLCALARRVG